MRSESNLSGLIDLRREREKEFGWKKRRPWEISMRMVRREFSGRWFYFSRASKPTPTPRSRWPWLTRGSWNTRVSSNPMERERERELYWGGWDGRWASNGDSSGGFFNVATPVITSALTGDDSPSPPADSLVHRDSRERERERANSG